MTDKELQKLSRSALLEMLLEQSRENDRLRAQVEELARQLSDRQFKIDQAGSIAEASMQINQVFEAAQAAAEQYLENIRALSGRFAGNWKKKAPKRPTRFSRKPKENAGQWRQPQRRNAQG